MARRENEIRPDERTRADGRHLPARTDEDPDDGAVACVDRASLDGFADTTHLPTRDRRGARPKAKGTDEGGDGDGRTAHTSTTLGAYARAWQSPSLRHLAHQRGFGRRRRLTPTDRPWATVVARGRRSLTVSDVSHATRARR
ncbi:hypothetical protein AKJ09_02408 [Labilithrix luteola]|uniref:Uncharacterized protein n=1 Tax=Labilithrix luteola TaxID=1391654 RepID=A0A0K1PRL2_9BACT|nr:hypothetical protein AKJ09_02408 [Labilithrix luteola]